MSSNNLIGLWALGVWENLGTPDCLNYLTISGYAIQPDTLGRLNIRIGTCYQPTGATGNGSYNYDVSPDLTNTELSIIGAMYEVSYFRHLAMSTMGQGGDNIPWTKIREADSSIERTNPVNIGKEYRESAKDANERLNYLVNAYIGSAQGGSSPRQVAYLNPPIYPNIINGNSNNNRQ